MSGTGRSYAEWFNELLSRLDADDAAELLANPVLSIYVEDDERDLVAARSRFEADMAANTVPSWSGAGADAVRVLPGGIHTTMKRGHER